MEDIKICVRAMTVCVSIVLYAHIWANVWPACPFKFSECDGIDDVIKCIFAKIWCCGHVVGLIFLVIWAWI